MLPVELLATSDQVGSARRVRRRAGSPLQPYGTSAGLPRERLLLPTTRLSRCFRCCAHHSARLLPRYPISCIFLLADPGVVRPAQPLIPSHLSRQARTCVPVLASSLHSPASSCVWADSCRHGCQRTRPMDPFRSQRRHWQMYRDPRLRG